MKDNVLPQVCNEVMEIFSNLLVIGLVDDGRRAVVYVGDVSANDIVGSIKMFGKKSLHNKNL